MPIQHPFNCMPDILEKSILKFFKILMHPMQLYLLKNNDLKAYLKYEEIKWCFVNESMFHILSFKLFIIFCILQKSDCFMQKQRSNIALVVQAQSNGNASPHNN